MSKSDKIIIKITIFIFRTLILTFRDIFFFVIHREFLKKVNFIPLIGITIFLSILAYKYNYICWITILFIPIFFYFIPRTMVINKVYQIKRKRYHNIISQLNLSNGNNYPYFTHEFRIDEEQFNIKEFLFKKAQNTKKYLRLPYTKVKEKGRKKIFFRNNLHLNDWLKNQDKLGVLLNTNIESIFYHKGYKNIVIQCNKEKINYEKIYANKNLELIDRFKAVLDSLGLRYKIKNHEDNLFSYVVKILTRHNLKDFTSIKQEFCHRIQFLEERLNIFSQEGLIVFKFSLDMKTLSFIEEYRKLTKTTILTKKAPRIPIYIGKNEEGKNIIFDLLDYYHWLIAGSTGQGKSNLLNVILSCIFLNRNKIAKYYLLDPKKVELSRYKKLKNVVYKNEQNDILNQLLELQNEMANRYKLFESRECLDIDEWNEKFPNEKIGYIVIIIDEIANLMLSEHKKVFHDVLQKLGQEARGAGFRIILVTQCANGDVIKETIKVNYINRVCMQVDNWTSSKVILDDKIGVTLKNPGEIILKLNNNFDKIKVPLISKKEIPKIIEGIERINGLNE